MSRVSNPIDDGSNPAGASSWLQDRRPPFDELVAGVEDYAIFTLSAKGVVLDWNRGAQRIKGYTAAEIVNRHHSCFYSEGDRTAGTPDAALKTAATEGRFSGEGWRLRRDGSRFWAHVTITALRSESGAIEGFLKITRDLTDRRQVELLEESGRRKDAFLAILAHELRNPLAPILTGVDIIARSPGDTGRIREVSATLRRQVDQMARLIDDLLDMSRITTGKITLKKIRTSIGDILERALETVKPVMDEMGQHLHLSLPPQPLPVDADPHRLAQIIANLLSNAAKYTPPGGHISLTATVEENAVLRIEVKDDGKGIAAEYQKTIFELFDQGGGGSPEGLGIGLTLVRSLTELHGGKVSVSSMGEGRGSLFTLLLPILAPAEDTLADHREPAAGAKRHDAPLRVIVADDGRSAADIMGMFFQLEGMETAVAYDGQEAVDLAQTFTPDFVFLDLGMPRLDGFEACRRIRRMHPGVVLVALSGWGSKEDRLRTAEAGFDCHLVKPAAPADLRDLIARHRPAATAGEKSPA